MIRQSVWLEYCQLSIKDQLKLRPQSLYSWNYACTVSVQLKLRPQSLYSWNYAHSLCTVEITPTVSVQENRRMFSFSHCLDIFNTPIFSPSQLEMREDHKSRFKRVIFIIFRGGSFELYILIEKSTFPCIAANIRIILL